MGRRGLARVARDARRQPLDPTRAEVAGPVSEPQTVFGVGVRDRGKRLDLFLHERIPGLSRSRIQRAIEERVTLSWEVRPRASTPVRPGGEVRIGYTPIVEEIDDTPIPILARGTGWIAVDKPSGIPVHPVNSVRENSLIRMLRRQENDEGLRLAHRLDRETTGVLLVAKTAEAASVLSTAFERGKVRKEYLAVVAGELEEEAGTIDLAIGEIAGTRVFVRRHAVEDGEPARTAWRVERRLTGKTLLRLFPETTTPDPGPPGSNRPPDPGRHPLRPPRRRLPRPGSRRARRPARGGRTAPASPPLRTSWIPRPRNEGDDHGRSSASRRFPPRDRVASPPDAGAT